MNSGISVSLLGLACLGPVALFLAHVLASRCGIVRWLSPSPQLALVRLALFFNAPVLGGTWLIALHENRGILETTYMLLFAFLTFNAVVYAYFHLFNMSETARRIRMLLQIRQAGAAGLPVRELESGYSPKHMIEARLDRLVKMRQLVLDTDGRYRVSGQVLLWAGRIMAWWRRLVLRRIMGNPE